jgi:hypothetical protein
MLKDTGVKYSLDNVVTRMSAFVGVYSTSILCVTDN